MSIIDGIGLCLAGRWISGVTIRDAISDAKRVNSAGERAMINYLGEGVSNVAEAGRVTGVYIMLLRAMKAGGIRGCVAVKPTQLGLAVGPDPFLSNYREVIREASRLGIFVWTDMEDYAYVDSTIRAYLSVATDFDNVGICLQARLKRTYRDIRRICRSSGRVRLVKGAYDNKGGVAYTGRDEVDRNYTRCMRYLFGHSSFFIVATHDRVLIDKATAMQKGYSGRAAFAMLKGIRTGLAQRLVDDGREVYVYMPFGDKWMQYSMRRLKEAGSLALIARSVIGG